MKLLKVKWHNDPVLGDLQLDFRNPTTGKPYNTVVLLGENGTGKTTILNSLFRFIFGHPIGNIEKLDYDIDGVAYSAIPTGDDDSNWNGYYDIRLPNNDLLQITTGINQTGGTSFSTRIDNDPRNVRSYFSFYSRAESNFKTEPIVNVTAQQWDNKPKQYSQEDVSYSSLKQMIVDIDDQDCREFVSRCKKVQKYAWNDFFPESKIFKFSRAIKYFFENIEFEKVEDQNGEKQILFNKNGSLIPIDSLSSGEKQIVFRGLNLLKSNNYLKGGCIFIDEPEISMHPKWGRKILSFYQSLVSDSEKNQYSQIFLATHSDHVLHQVISDSENIGVIILKADGNGITGHKIDKPFFSKRISIPEINYLAFDIPSNDYHTLLYSAVQAKFEAERIKDCDNKILKSKFFNLNEHSKKYEYLGKKAGQARTYQTICSYIRNAIHHPDEEHKFTEEELRSSIELLRTILLNE